MAYCTVDDVCRRFGADENNIPSHWNLDATAIQKFIDKNENVIDDLYNGTFEETTYTDEYIDAPGKDNEIITANRPIGDIASMYRRTGTDSWTQLTDVTTTRNNAQADGFILRDSSAGIIKLTSSYEHPGCSYGDDYSGWDDLYKITYDAGYATAPFWVKDLCTDMTQRDIIMVLRHNGSAEAVDMLNAYRDSIKMLTADIDVGKKRVRRHRRPGVGVF